MQVETTPLKDCLIIKDKVFRDDRGYFFESFNQRTFSEVTGTEVVFVQDNQSSSQYGVLRGLHFQKGVHAQAKLVRVLQGRVLDVAVDIRPSSPSFGRSFAIELSDTSGTQLFIPRGFAHGFLVLSETATFFYKCDNYYNKESESGIAYDDPDLEIDWGIDASDIILSEKDRNNPTLQQLVSLL
jgi:dTDP-4-dehydrorhamnose 3,5-epimerase